MKQALLELIRLKRRWLIALGLLLLVNAALFALIGAWQEPALGESRRAWNDLRGRAAALGRGDVTAAYRQGKSDLERLRGMIPARREFPRLLGDIMDAAASSGVAVGGLSYKPQVVKDENLLAYGVTMSVNGRYAAVKSFLADLQGNRELVVIDGVGLSNPDPFVESVSMELRLTVYLREGA